MVGSENTPRIGLVKAPVNLFGNKIADVNSHSLKKDLSMKDSSKAKELHRARREIGRYEESTLAAESKKAEAETELSNAYKTVKDLFSMIGESSYKAKARMHDITSLKKFGKVRRNDDNEYSEVMIELDYAKRELFELKLDVASVLEEKQRAEKEIEASRSSMLSCTRVAQELRKEIEEASEEQVVVELARMDALKELRDTKARREKEAKEFSFKLESTRKKLEEATRETDESKELETKLAMTMYDIYMLKNELQLVKKMEKRVERNESMDRVEDVTVLQTIKEQIETAKKDLALIREKGFQFMASMDAIRNELKHVNTSTVNSKNAESKASSKVRSLSSKLLRAKSKLEALSAAEEKVKSIVTNLSYTLDKLKSEAEASKKENELTNEEVKATKEEVKKALLEIDTSEERLQGSMLELEALKSSEVLALEKLRRLSEHAMKERSLATQPSSLITISKFEYEYLTNHAAGAKEIADKKVEAAKAWVEAVKASERETVMKTKIAEGKLEVYRKEKLVSKRVIGNGNEELENWGRKREKNPSRELKRGMSRKSIKSDGKMTPSRGSKFQKSASPAPRHLSPFPFVVKKKKKVIPNFTKFFRGKRNTAFL
ncbi:protein PLASTID MOVEMENT IMPAIRED 2-like [Abrus precatorius]|uniref:Protein PLASTID MOVEMENT IMPAIRED 2-like n=1 Tax=Abrus precatorius TaxID=3816 RepID=A0A8B8LTL8_ABRPR|nr:protein PLASTID MOVEMENT IMPAIRED 2-like [Abrus precatorius]XP_027358224.1 protein PLASTID MOVEMENT IMPAIRED 2-like [Abrus precatorius]